MIEGEHLVKEHEACVWCVKLIRGERRQTLDLAHHVIAEEANRARSERREAWELRGCMLTQCLLEYVKDVTLKRPALLPLHVGKGAAVGDQLAVGAHADEGVTANAFTALNGLEQKRFGFSSGDTQKRGDRSFQICVDRAVNRDQRVVLALEQEKLMLVWRGIGRIPGRCAHALYLTQRMISGRFGFLPYIRMPTR